MKIYFSPSFIQEPVNLANYREEGQKYFLLVMLVSEHLILENPNILLLVPDDNSTFAQQIKEVVDRDETYHCVFATPAENLRFKPNFWSAKNKTYHGLVIKDTGRVEKIVGNNSKPVLEPSQITFKAIKWTEKEKNEWGSYVGELEVEPLSLGIEGLSPITHLNFKFITKENPRPGPSDPGIKELTESELWKSKILPESAGKIFTMKTKKFFFGYYGDPTALTFTNSNDYVFGSLQEKKSQDNSEGPTKTPPKNDNFDNPPPELNSTKPETSKNSGTLKVVLITDGIIVGLIFLAFVFLSLTKKKKKKLLFLQEILN